MSVTTFDRGFRAPAAAAGAFPMSAFWNSRDVSVTICTLPAPSTRKSVGVAPAPCPRITDT